MTTTRQLGRIASPRRLSEMADWIAGAWRRLGWRHVGLALGVFLLASVFGPLGGAWLYAGRSGRQDPVLNLLASGWFVEVLPVVFAALVADEAHDAGTRPLVAYGVAWLVCDAALPFLRPLLWALVGAVRIRGPFHWFVFVELLFVGGAFMTAWGHFHVSRRAVELAQQAEIERALQKQRLLGARLAAQQARIEPQFLFDALSKVNEIGETDADRANHLLADLIVLLRAMLPTPGSGTSTVEREFALADAWTRVQGQLGEPVPLVIACDASAAALPLAPMLVLPMLRVALGNSTSAAGPWRLEAIPSDSASPRRLQIALTSSGLDPAGQNAEPQDGFDALRGRALQLYGVEGQVHWTRSIDRSALVIDLPLRNEAAR